METFNLTHYMKVRDARRDAGLPVHSGNGKVEGHPLVGKVIRDHTKAYTIESVHKHWLHGWYLGILLNNGQDSHRFMTWENINCADPLILDQIAQNRSDFWFDAT